MQKLVLGQLSSRKIAPNLKTNPNPNRNPKPNRGAIFLESNCPDTAKINLVKSSISVEINLL